MVLVKVVYFAQCPIVHAAAIGEKFVAALVEHLTQGTGPRVINDRHRSK